MADAHEVRDELAGRRRLGGIAAARFAEDCDRHGSVGDRKSADLQRFRKLVLVQPGAREHVWVAGELFADILQLRVRRRKLRRQGEDAAAELRFAFVVSELRSIAAVPHHREDRLALVVQSNPGRGRDDIEKRRTHVVAKYRTLRYLLLTR